MQPGASRTNRRPVAFFLPDLGGGGAERVIVVLANAYAERGVDVDLVLAKKRGVYTSVVSPQVNVVHLGASRLLFAIPSLVRYLHRTRPAVLLSTIYHANVGALLARRISGTETLTVIRASSTTSLNTEEVGTNALRLARRLIRYVYPWADRIVAVSEGVAQDLSQVYGLPRERIDVIYNPTVTEELFSLAHEEPGHNWFDDGEPPVILGVGRLTRAKNFSALIRAFALVHEKENARLMILGEGAERQSLEALVSSLHLSRDVALPGFVRNPFAYMRRAAVFVLSSDWEGLPNALIQAMACGCSVVATDCPSGPREILAGGKYGHLVPPGDVPALAAAITDVLRGTGRSVSERWLDQFSVEPVINEYQRVMEISSRAFESW